MARKTAHLLKAAEVGIIPRELGILATFGRWYNEYAAETLEHVHEDANEYRRELDEFRRSPRRIANAKRALATWYRILRDVVSPRLSEIWARPMPPEAYREVLERLGAELGIDIEGWIKDVFVRPFVEQMRTALRAHAGPGV